MARQRPLETSLEVVVVIRIGTLVSQQSQDMNVGYFREGNAWRRKRTEETGFKHAHDVMVCQAVRLCFAFLSLLLSCGVCIRMCELHK